VEGLTAARQQDARGRVDARGGDRRRVDANRRGEKVLLNYRGALKGAEIAERRGASHGFVIVLSGRLGLSDALSAGRAAGALWRVGKLAGWRPVGGLDDAVGAAHHAKSGKEELEPVTLLLGTSLA
jgi:hypothetical protein